MEGKGDKRMQGKGWKWKEKEGEKSKAERERAEGEGNLPCLRFSSSYAPVCIRIVPVKVYELNKTDRVSAHKAMQMQLGM